MDNYRKRIVDKLLERKLKSSGAVLIQGPKWCGKTTTALQLAKSSILCFIYSFTSSELIPRTIENSLYKYFSAN